MRIAALTCVVLLCAGCAGVGVVATSDPLTKLNDAEDLFERQDRPVIAERLIREAMATYQERGDVYGLGHAHREYADLLLSPAVSGSWAKFYKENGFQDKSVTFENRSLVAAEYYSRAIEYYNHAAEQLSGGNRYDVLTNVFYNMAHSYYRLGDRAKACGYYDEALKAYNENIRRNPNVRPYSPSGSVADMIAAKKKQVGCA